MEKFLFSLLIFGLLNIEIYAKDSFQKSDISITNNFEKDLVFNDFADFSILNKKEMKGTEGKFIHFIVPLAFTAMSTVGNNCGSCNCNKVY